MSDPGKFLIIDPDQIPRSDPLIFGIPRSFFTGDWPHGTIPHEGDDGLYYLTWESQEAVFELQQRAELCGVSVETFINIVRRAINITTLER